MLLSISRRDIAHDRRRSKAPGRTCWRTLVLHHLGSQLTQPIPISWHVTGGGLALDEDRG